MKKILALGEKIILRDGKEYTILPFTLEDMEWAMDKFSKINVEPIMINFYEEETRTILYEILTKILNYAHPDLSEEDIKKLIDLKIAKEILKIAIDISGYKMGGKEEEKKVVDWQKVIVPLVIHTSLTFDEIKKLTLPQLNAIWEELDEEIKRQYKLAGFEVQVDTKVATEQDINELMQFFGY